MFETLFKVTNKFMSGSNALTEEAVEVHNPYLIELKNLYKKYGAAEEEINFFGVRNEDDQRKDIWNDILGLFSGEDLYMFLGTTDPGDYFTRNPMNPKGTAHLCLGFHKRIWRVDKHKKKYTALCNRWGCNKQKVWRDVDKDFKQTKKDIIDIGYFGVNLHRASAMTLLQNIGRYSAGCQVIRSNEDFGKLMSVVLNSKTYKKNKLATFNYFLFDKSQISFYSDVITSLM